MSDILSSSPFFSPSLFAPVGSTTTSNKFNTSSTFCEIYETSRGFAIFFLIWHGHDSEHSVQGQELSQSTHAATGFSSTALCIDSSNSLSSGIIFPLFLFKHESINAASLEHNSILYNIIKYI
jgi:hypothetical protein